MKIFLISAQPVLSKYGGNILFNDVDNIVTNDIHFLDYDIDFDDVDALIFTSKNAIKSLLYNSNRLNNYKWRMIDSFVFGKTSAKYLKDNGGKVVFVKSDGSGNDFAMELLDLLRNKKALYLRAKVVVSKLVHILESNDINISEKIVYESKIKNINPLLKPPPNSILIFSAPSVYKAFLANFSWDETYIAIAIGDTTLSSFSKDIVSVKSSKQTIESCIEIARTIQTKNRIC